MSEQFCEAYEQCTKLEGKLLINQTLQGPSLAVPGDIGIGDLVGKGVLRPYCQFVYLVRWIPLEACKAPVRSVIGLAPGETMNLETAPSRNGRFHPPGAKRHRNVRGGDDERPRFPDARP